MGLAIPRPLLVDILARKAHKSSESASRRNRRREVDAGTREGGGSASVSENKAHRSDSAGLSGASKEQVGPDTRAGPSAAN
jgi:hypothetical protein